MDWWRSHHGAAMDPKYLVVAGRADAPPALVAAMVWALFEYASMQRPRGSVEGFDVEAFAAFHRADQSMCRSVFEVMASIGRPIHDNTQLIAWARRQDGADSPAAKRMRRMRERQKLEAQGRNVTPPLRTVRNHYVRGEKSEAILDSVVDLALAVTPKTIESEHCGSTVQGAAVADAQPVDSGKAKAVAKVRSGWLGRLTGASP